MSTNTELLKCIQGKQLIKIHKDVSNTTKNTKQQKDAKERFESGDIFESNVAEEESTTNEIIVHETDQNKDTLLRLLKKAEEEKNKLLEERQELIRKNQQLSLHIKELEKNLVQKSNTNDQMAFDKQVKEMVNKVLGKVFTVGQIKILMSQNENVRIRWTPEDITSAIALRSLSPKAYRYLRDVKKFPLPCLTTLHKWCSSFNIPPGILKDVLKIMKEKGQNFSIEQRLIVLTFDELYISNKVDLDRKEQKIYGSHKTCQFIMVRGLFDKWKQPIYYDFDKSMSADILLTVIKSLYEINYIVVAVTCDMGPTNMKLWNELNVGINISTHSGKKNVKQDIEKFNYIAHPADNSLKIYFYADVPHLLKLARNNLFDSGFKVQGKLLNKSCLEELLTINAGDLKIAHKLSRAHLDVRGTQRQNVRMAAQVFSNKNASAIQWCGEKKLLACNYWEETANVLKLFNDWFDIFNSKLKYGHNGSHAYGVNLEEQNKIIDNMNQFIVEMRVGERLTLLQFQKGILISNKSLVEMFLYLKEKYSSEAFQMEYLFTNRLNQDVLENLFSYLRMMGGGYDHPTPVELKNRLKWYILGKHSGYSISPGENTAGDNSSTILSNMEDTSNDEVYEPSCSLGISVNDEVFDDNEEKEEEEMLMKMSEEEEIDNEIEEILMGKDNDIEQREAENSEAINLSSYEPTLQELQLLKNFEQITANEIIEQNALLYIAGYVAHRFRNSYSTLGSPTKAFSHMPPDWLSFISRGNCMYPSPEFQRAAEIMNIEFVQFHGNFFNKEKYIFDKLTDIVCKKIGNSFPRKVIACLVRTRTYIRLRVINKEIADSNLIKKRGRKTYKICNKKNITMDARI